MDEDFNDSMMDLLMKDEDPFALIKDMIPPGMLCCFSYLIFQLVVDMTTEAIRSIAFRSIELRNSS